MPPSRPNILLLMADQQRGDCLGVEGHPVLETPNMDSLAMNGARFCHFYSPCPSCIATRRSLMTGQRPATHGMVGYADGVEWDAPPTLPGVLRDAGYQTRIVGRSMHLHPPRKRYGFDEMEIYCHAGADDHGEYMRRNGPPENGGWMGAGVFHNDLTARPWPLDEHLHHTNWTVQRALEFLRRRDPSCPYFLTVSFVAPHPPLQPPAFYFERYLRTGVPDPEIGDWATPPERTGKGRTGHIDDVAPQAVDLRGERLLSTRAGYYGLINHIDDQIRRLLNPVEGAPLIDRENTIVLYTSDHGEMLGDHHIWRKGVPYEASARVPFLVRLPRRFDAPTGVVCDAPATHADILPTLLDLVGVETPETADGASLAPFLRGERPAWRDYVHIEHNGYPMAVTDGREKYVWDPPTGTEHFFDLSRDPHENHDRIAEPACAERIAFWRARMVESLDGRPEGFVDEGTLVPGRPCTTLLPTVPQTRED